MKKEERMANIKRGPRRRERNACTDLMDGLISPEEFFAKVLEEAGCPVEVVDGSVRATLPSGAAIELSVAPGDTEER